MKQENQLYRYPFLVGERAYCVWEWNLPELNQQFIRRLDPKYFHYVAETNYSQIEGENNQRAAIAMRTAYHHGLEALFAIVFSTLQAPECIPGWLHKYTNAQLRALCKQAQYELPIIPNRLGLEQTNWPSIVNKLMPISSNDPELISGIHDGFTKAWTRFANDLIDINQQDEYNSIKHGFRVNPGGFTLSFGVEDISGVPSKPENMKPLGGSVYGTSFYKPSVPDNATEDFNKSNFRLKTSSLNWIPELVARRLQLISISIANVIGYLKTMYDMDGDEVRFHAPSDLNEFDLPWSKSTGTTHASFNLNLDVTEITPMTSDEIKATYKTSGE